MGLLLSKIVIGHTIVCLILALFSFPTTKFTRWAEPKLGSYEKLLFIIIMICIIPFIIIGLLWILLV